MGTEEARCRRARRVVHRSYVRRPLVVARLAHDGGLAVAGGIVFRVYVVVRDCCPTARRDVDAWGQLIGRALV